VPRQPKVRRGAPRRTIAAPDESQKLLDHAAPWLRVLILLGLHTGLRISDAIRVTPEHYNPEAQTLTITQIKTGQPVTLPITETLRDLFAKAPAGEPGWPLFALYKGRVTQASNVTKAWARLKRKTRVNPDLRFHDLRRTLAVSLYEISKDLRVAEHMLGHKSLTSTIQYLEHRDAEKLRPYLEAIHRPVSKAVN
jgi:integrase